MPEQTVVQRQAIQDALKRLASEPLPAAAKGLLAALGYRSDKTADFGDSAENLLSRIETFQPEYGPIDRARAGAEHWKSCAFLFQLTNDEIPSLAANQMPLGADSQIAPNQMESFVFIAIDLRGEQCSRTRLAAITRELNKRFPMPAILLFRQESCFSLTVIDRRQNRRDANRDVIDRRVTVIKDVSLERPHRAHIDILASLALANLGDRRRPGNFRELYDAWIEALSTQALNERFYKELACWYLWAVREVEFPKGGGQDRNAIGVIRLLTRLIFVWFIKEKGLVPETLFERDALKTLLKQAPDAAPEESNYYHAILQNLFFATLNTEMGEKRQWARTGIGMKGDYLISLVYRHREAFREPDAVLQDYFAGIPFLNGGLFECLDEYLDAQDFVRRPELKELAVQEGKGYVLRVDGFSRRPEAQAKAPNKLFFGSVEDVDLNAEFETKGRRYPVKGLIDLLEGYRFTVDENTPLEEEVALDPELLGKVFENLLASYNPDTRNTARKQSGSFYTPREVVDYMVDEALIAYFVRHLRPSSAGERGGKEKGRAINEVLDLGAGAGELDLAAVAARTQNRIPASAKEEYAKTIENRLRGLFSHADTGHDFSKSEIDTLVAAIENLKALDPACGSGAFLMGILTKLFLALKKLDPENRRWRAQNLAPLKKRLEAAKSTPDPLQRESETEEAKAALEKYERDFAAPAYADYTRKLYLIEKCIFGSDIQPIAVQIAKLRFFISLIVSQPIDRDKPNFGVTPLPNLETKIVAANTLFGVPRRGDAQGSLLNNPEIAQKEAELRDACAAHFVARTHAAKKRQKEKVQKLHEELVDLLKRDSLVTKQDAERMARWNPFDQNRFADFFDVEWMFGIPRVKDNTEAVFDIVIGNPPYVRQEGIKELKPLLKDIYKYECYSGTADLFVYFYERAVKLLKPQGILSFITSNKWYRARYGENLRLFMATHTRLKSIIDFGDEAVFTAVAYPTIVIAARREKPLNPPPATDQARVLNWTQEHPVEEFPAVFQEAAFDVPQAELKKEGWQLEPPGKRQLLKRIQAAGRPLGEYVNGRFYYGIKTGFNEAFVIDGATRNRLIAEDEKSAEVIKPFLRGRDVKRWKVEFEGQFLIKIESSENVRHPWSGKPESEAEKVFARNYPAIHKHFQNYRQGMINRYDQGRYFWELRACIYWQEFEQPKIVFPDIAVSPQFAWDINEYYLVNTAYIIPQVEKWVLSILNSSACAWFYSQISPQIQNGYYRFIAQYVGQIPIPSGTAKQKALLSSTVDAILATRDHRYERLINGLVFELFFPDELHAANIRLFDACERVGVGKLAALRGDALARASEELATAIFANDHPIYAMLFDLQALEVARVIEGKE